MAGFEDVVAVMGEAIPGQDLVASIQEKSLGF